MAYLSLYLELAVVGMVGIAGIMNRAFAGMHCDIYFWGSFDLLDGRIWLGIYSLFPVVLGVAALCVPPKRPL